MNRIIFCLLWLTTAYSLPLAAIDSAQIQVGKWSFAGISAEQFDVSTQITDKGLILTATAAQLFLPEPWHKISQVSLRCKTMSWRSGQFTCQDGQVAFLHERYGQQRIEFSIQALPAAQQYQFVVKPIRLAGSAVSVTGKINDDNWQVDVSANQLDLEQIKPLLTDWLSEQQLKNIDAFSLQGKFDITAVGVGVAEQLTRLKLSWQATETGFSNEDGTQVAETLHARGTAVLEHNKSAWQWQATTSLDAGQVFSNPIFIDFTEQPISLNASGSASLDFNTIDAAQLLLKQPGSFDVDMSMSLVDGAVNHVDVRQTTIDLTTFYPIWLQPFAMGTEAAKLDVNGQVNAVVHWQPTDYSLQLTLRDISVIEQDERFSLQGVYGDIDIGSDATPRTSHLSWLGARLYTIPIGIAEVNMESIGQRLELIDGVNLPVMDGLLVVNDFSLQRYDSGLVDWTFDGMLTPISMEKLSKALDWPVLHGMLSGVIPEVRYQNQQLTIGGALQVKVFDGTTIIRDLSMTSPLGSLPQLNANIDIMNLDLEVLTRAFDMGRIAGRMDGYVHNLHLADWEPVQFDARLATSETNPGKRQISQKAVDNLTQIGGGATGMLSRSFLRFFEDFSYQKLGVSCRLRNGVCQMDGVEKAEQGYYIVKGGGGLPPWINVVGYTRQVDWTDLIARLKAVQDSDGPVIQ